MHFPDGRIVRTIHRPEGPVAGDAALEFFLSLLDDRFFQRISATANENHGRDEESDGEGLQAQRILKKVTSDK